MQKKEHRSESASMGVADVDDAKAAATARTIAEEKCIVSEDVMRSAEYSRKTDGFYVLNYHSFSRMWLFLQTDAYL